MDASSSPPFVQIVVVEAKHSSNLYHTKVRVARAGEAARLKSLPKSDEYRDEEIVARELESALRIRMDRSQAYDEGLQTVQLVEHFRHNLSAFILWSIFLVLYVGGALLLLLGMIFSAQAWWTLVHQEASLWAIGMTTGEILVMAAAFFMVLLIPLLQRRGAGHINPRREIRRFGVERVPRSSNQVA